MKGNIERYRSKTSRQSKQIKSRVKPKSAHTETIVCAAGGA